MPGSASYDYQCKLVSITDGDTVTVDVDLGFAITFRQTLRVYGLNCRETHTKNPTEKAAGLSDKAFAESLLPIGVAVTIHSHKADDPEEKYGRWLATIALPDGRDFAKTMIDAEHGAAYFGGKR